MTSKTEQSQLKGWHVLIWLTGFFGLMFAVNGVFLYQAITSFPGEDTPKSYLQGLEYNRILNERAAQAELGWTAQVGVLNEELVLRLVDRDGNPVSYRPVELELSRLATTAADTTLTLDAVAPGEYRTDVSGLISGRWNADIKVFDFSGDRVEFEMTKQITSP